jgi:hypothetical protein
MSNLGFKSWWISFTKNLISPEVVICDSHELMEAEALLLAHPIKAMSDQPLRCVLQSKEGTWRVSH